MANKGINKVIIMGRVAKDPVTGALPNGSAAFNCVVATSEQWRDKQSGENQERVEWHKITIFGKLAEIAGSYVTKGMMLYVEGKNRTRKWTKDGVDHYTTEVVADEIQFFNTASRQSNDADGNQADQGGYGSDQFDDDIPF